MPKTPKLSRKAQAMLDTFSRKDMIFAASEVLGVRGTYELKSQYAELFVEKGYTVTRLQKVLTERKRFRAELAALERKTEKAKQATYRLQVEEYALEKKLRKAREAEKATMERKRKG